MDALSALSTRRRRSPLAPLRRPRPPQDYFYRRAKEEQYRARSAYKLQHVAESTGVFEGVTAALDLCAAPGSWSQLLARRFAGVEEGKGGASSAEAGARVVAVDLQEMAPIEGVSIIQADITLASTAEEILRRFKGVRPQIVVCDGAPDVTGLHSVDEYLHSQLVFAAVGCAARVLSVGGSFVAKIFKNENVGLLVEQLNVIFATVEVVKPSSSRVRSAEHFVVAKGFRSLRLGPTPEPAAHAMSDAEGAGSGSGTSEPAPRSVRQLHAGVELLEGGGGGSSGAGATGEEDEAERAALRDVFMFGSTHMSTKPTLKVAR